jgi:hypothetical protein
MREIMMYRFSQWLLMITMTYALFLVGCFNPRNTPVFRKLAEEEGRKSAKYTEEALQKSPDLQELDRLCTQDVPTYEGFTLISYFFDSAADYRQVKPFYLDYFARNGWKMTNEYDGDWGSKSVEFRRGYYRVILYHRGMGDAEYGFHCEKLSDAGEPLPNKGMNATREQRGS